MDAKYEKFSANASPKTSRKKFLSSRQPAKRKRKTSASSKTRENGQRNGSSMTTGTNCSSHSGNGSNTAVEVALAAVNNTSLPADHFIPPKEISSKYAVGDIIGDGNFAVVRKCRSRKTKSDFALKIIDKSKTFHRSQKR